MGARGEDAAIKGKIVAVKSKRSEGSSRSSRRRQDRPEVYERWNREAGKKLPERVKRKKEEIEEAPHREAARPEVIQMGATARALGTSRARIVVVDDSRDAVLSAMMLLEDEGHEVRALYSVATWSRWCRSSIPTQCCSTSLCPA